MALADSSVSAVSPIEALWERAKQMDLAHSPAWLKLGHYRRRGLTNEWRSEADGARFFLSPRGRTSPEAELEATLRAFAGDLGQLREEQEAQCRFLARRRLIDETLAWRDQGLPWAECRGREAWLATLAPERVWLVFAASYMNNPASMFGHTFFKFRTQANPQDRDLLNYGINFAADTGVDGGLMFMWRGLTGGYPGRFTMQPYHQFLKSYTNLDGRDIWEYELNLSPATVRFLMEHLLELEQTYFAYYFIDANCSYYLLSALEAVRPDLELTPQASYFVIPADTVRAVLNHKLVVRQHFRPSLQRQFAQTVSSFDRQDHAWLSRLANPQLELAPLPNKDWLALARPQKMALFDAALLKLAIKDPQNGPVTAARSHMLKLWRAELGPREESAPAPAEKKDELVQPLEKGHDSRAVGLAGGTFDGRGFVELLAHPAYHDRLAKADGYLEASHMEIAHTVVRLEGTERRLRLQQFYLLQLLSLAPSDRHFQHLSWRILLGAERGMDKGVLSTLDPVALGGLGMSTSMGRARASLLAQTYAQFGEDLEGGNRLGWGPLLELALRATPDWRWLANFELRKYELGERSTFAVFTLAQAANLSRNSEVRLEYSLINAHDQARIGMLWYF